MERARGRGREGVRQDVLLNKEQSQQQQLSSLCTAMINEFQTAGHYSTESPLTALCILESVGSPCMEM